MRLRNVPLNKSDAQPGEIVDLKRFISLCPNQNPVTTLEYGLREIQVGRSVFGGDDKGYDIDVTLLHRVEQFCESIVFMNYEADVESFFYESQIIGRHPGELTGFVDESVGPVVRLSSYNDWLAQRLQPLAFLLV